LPFLIQGDRSIGKDLSFQPLTNPFGCYLRKQLTHRVLYATLSLVATMPPRRRLPSFSMAGNHPLWSYLHTGTLLRLISLICHSYENCRGVGVFFPNWNHSVSAFSVPLRYILVPSLIRRRFPFQPSIDRRFRLGRKDPDLVGTVNFQLPLPLSLLSATLTTAPISVHSKALTEMLNPLDATLTKNTGVGATSFNSTSFTSPRGASRASGRDMSSTCPISLLSPSRERAWTKGPALVYRSKVADRIVGPAL